MEEVGFNKDVLLNELNMKAYINMGLTIKFIDSDENKTTTFCYKNGIKDLIDSECKKKLFDTIYFKDLVSTNLTNSKKEIKIEIETGLTYSSDIQNKGNISSFCNSLYTSDGGTHITGFKMALTSIINKYIDDNKIKTKRDENLNITGDDINENLYAVISIKHPCPKFDSQTKNKLSSTEVLGAVKKFMNDKFMDFLNNNEKLAKIICQKVIATAKANENARKAKDATSKRDNVFSAVSDISKLSNCISKNPDETELFITEGNSAGGTAQACRDKKFQAIYSLRGKPLNSNNLSPIKILENKELSDLVYILTGKRNLDNNFNIEDIKYKKICVLSDADVDGSHIASLLVNFFYRHCKEVITRGYLFITLPPLYSIIERNKKRYFLNQEEYDNYIYEKLSNKYYFRVNGKKCSKINNIKNLCFIINKYKDLLENKESLNGISSLLIDDLMFLYDPNDKNTKNKIKKQLSTIGDFIENNENYDGLYKDSFISFNLNNLMNILKEIYSFKSSIKFPNDIKIYDISNNNEISFNIEIYNSIIDEITPKSRNRMKGLGEMNANELWETTLDPNNRNLLKVVLSDDEGTNDVMETLLNPNNTEQRKAFLMKNQQKVLEIDLD